jgi:hypothetical protein
VVVRARPDDDDDDSPESWPQQGEAKGVVITESVDSLKAQYLEHLIARPEISGPFVSNFEVYRKCSKIHEEWSDIEGELNIRILRSLDGASYNRVITELRNEAMRIRSGLGASRTLNRDPNILICGLPARNWMEECKLILEASSIPIIPAASTIKVLEQVVTDPLEKAEKKPTPEYLKEKWRRQAKRKRQRRKEENDRRKVIIEPWTGEERRKTLDRRSGERRTDEALCGEDEGKEETT